MIDKKTSIDYDLTVRGLTRLRSYEFFNLYDDVMNRLGMMEFSSELLRQSISALSSHQATISLLKSWKRAHDVSELIDEMSSRSRELLMGIRDATDAALKLGKDDAKDEIRSLANWTKDVRANMGSTNRSVQRDVVKTMRERLADTELQETIEKYGLLVPFNEIRALQSQMATYRALRDVDNKNNRDVRVGFRTLVMTDLRLMLAVLEASARYTDNELDKAIYLDACISLDKLLVNACAPAKARATRSMNEKNVESDEQPDEGIDTTPESDHNPDVGSIEGDDVNDNPSE